LKKANKLRKEQSDDKKFNSLVQSYKSKLLATQNAVQKSKWFD
jgi:hypothetical protein